MLQGCSAGGNAAKMQLRKEMVRFLHCDMKMNLTAHFGVTTTSFLAFLSISEGGRTGVHVFGVCLAKRVWEIVG
jgi:hypothetical protein